MRSFILSVFLLLLSLSSYSQAKMDISALGVAGYSDTRGVYGGTDLDFVLHTSSSDVIFNMEALSSKDFSVGLSTRPVWKLGPCIIFADGSLHSRIFATYDTYEFVYSGSLGCSMKHFLVQAGIFARMIGDSDRRWHSFDQIQAEPFNFLYRVELKLRGDEAPWDLVARCSDFTEYEYERHWQPIFSLSGRYDLSDRLSLVAEGTLKPSGMFHLDASFYSAWLKAGINYSF